MPNVLKILRSMVPGSRPSGRTYGEMYANLADKQFGVFDNSNNPQDLVGVPFFSPSIPYPAGAAVNYGGVLYLATTAIAAGAFNPAQWAQVQPAGGFSTGDAKLTLKVTADPTWIMMDDGTIGDASSGASTRANADCQALFTLMWNNISDTWAPVLLGATTGRGANAAADWAAHKKITLTRQLGRALIVGGSGVGLTGRPLGGYLGEEKHAQNGNELCSHFHSFNSSNYFYQAYGGLYYAVDPGSQQYVCIYGNYLQPAGNTSTGGASTPANVMQPSATWNIMLKL